MFSNRRTLIALAVVAAGLCIAFESSVRAQSLIVPIKAKVKDIFTLNLAADMNQTETMYTVPADRKFVLTDVIVENSNASSARLTLNPSGLNLSIPGGSTFQHGFVTGIQMFEGATLEVTNVNGAIPMFVHVSGYLLKD